VGTAIYELHDRNIFIRPGGHFAGVEQKLDYLPVWGGDGYLS
jgi:hypothetical protein